MKKNLLVTLGDSFTEGIGCYDPALNPDRVYYYYLPKEKQALALNRFHEFGWPNLVGKELGFDKVLNFGLGGASNDGQLKVFVDKVLPKIKSLNQEFDIKLIWMMTDPTRMGFYTKDNILKINPAFGNSKHQKSKIEGAYMEEMRSNNFSPIREQIHIIKLSEFMFNSLNIECVFTSWEKLFLDIYEFYNSPNFLTPHPSYIIQSKDIDKMSIACLHPNELGYRFMADQIIDNLKTFHPRFVFEKKDEFEWEWDGSTAYTPNKTYSLLWEVDNFNSRFI